MPLLLLSILAISSLPKSSNVNNAVIYITQRYWATVQHDESDDISCKHLSSFPVLDDYGIIKSTRYNYVSFTL